MRVWTVIGGVAAVGALGALGVAYLKAWGHEKRIDAIWETLDAAGSGTQIQDVNRLLKQVTQMQKMMKRMRKKGGMANLMQGMAGMGGRPGMPRPR